MTPKFGYKERRLKGQEISLKPVFFLNSAEMLAAVTASHLVPSGRGLTETTWKVVLREPPVAGGQTPPPEGPLPREWPSGV